MKPYFLTTDRLRLRSWDESDRELFFQLNSDPEVMEYYRSTLNRSESDAFVDRIQANFSERGWGLWAVEIVGLSQPEICEKSENSSSCQEVRGHEVVGFIGYVGLSIPKFDAHFTPCVEIGWRLARHAWGHGFATEAASEVRDFAFETLKLAEIVSFTSASNTRSRRVMQRLNMTHDPREDFEHPSLPIGHRLSRHVLYRLKNPSSEQREI